MSGNSATNQVCPALDGSALKRRRGSQTQPHPIHTWAWRQVRGGHRRHAGLRCSPSRCWPDGQRQVHTPLQRSPRRAPSCQPQTPPTILGQREREFKNVGGGSSPPLQTLGCLSLGGKTPEQTLPSLPPSVPCCLELRKD